MNRTTLKRAAQASIPALVLPMMAAAADLQTILNQIRSLLNYAIGILFILVTLYFIWGIVQYVTAGGDDAKINKGKQHMIWGIIGMVVMAGAWGIVRIVMNYFGITSGTGGVTLPTF